MKIEKNTYASEVRVNMRGGEGQVTLSALAKEELPSMCRLLSTITLPAGASIGHHVHENETEIFYILEGTPEITDDDATYVAQPGDTILTGPGHGHAVKNGGDGAVRMLAVIIKEA